LISPEESKEGDGQSYPLIGRKRVQNCMLKIECWSFLLEQFIEFAGYFGV
jgi:hypothetical protein